MYVYICISIYIYMYVHIYIHITSVLLALEAGSWLSGPGHPGGGVDAATEAIRRVLAACEVGS